MMKVAWLPLLSSVIYNININIIDKNIIIVCCEAVAVAGAETLCMLFHAAHGDRVW